MATTIKSKGNAKRTTGNWKVKLQGETIDMVRAGRNGHYKDESEDYRFIILNDSDHTGTDDRDEIRQIVADMIREIRNDAIESRRDRDNDELDEAIESIKDADKARKALEVLRAAGLIG